MEEQQNNHEPDGTEPVVIKPQATGDLKINHETPPSQQEAVAAPSVEDTQAKPKEQNPPQWQYQSGQLSQEGTIALPAAANETAPPHAELTEDSIKWNASEFVSHEKSISWYILLAFVALVLAAAIYLITKDIFSVVVICLIAVAVGVFGALKPRVLDYAISPNGIQVGNKNFGFETFRSFSVIQDDPMPSIQLLPQKRFMVPITMYFAPTDGDHIVKVLGDYLPFEPKGRDLVDKISSKFHF